MGYLVRIVARVKEKAMRVEFRGDFYFLPVLEVLAERHELSSIVTFSRSASAFREIARRTGAELMFITDRASTPGVREDSELCVVAGYPFKLTLPAGTRGLNIHPSLLPQGRGPDPHTHILLGKRAAAGVSIHKLSPQIDAGDIVAQRPIELTRHDSSLSYLIRCGLVAADLLERVLLDFDAAWEHAKSQATGSWWSMADPHLSQIVAGDTVDQALAKFSAFYAQSWFEFTGKRRNILSISAWQNGEITDQAPGTVIFNALDIVVLKVLDGYVLMHFAPLPMEAAA